MKSIRMLAAVVAVLALAGAAAADVVWLQNGQTLQGAIKQYDNVRVIITVGGRDLIVASDQVARIQYGEQGVVPFPGGMYGSQLPGSFFGVGEMYAGPRRVIVSAARASLRVGPGTEYTLLAELPRDAILTALGETAQWYRVSMPDGSNAWLSKSVCRLLQPPVQRYYDYYRYNNYYGAVGQRVPAPLPVEQGWPQLEQAPWGLPPAPVPAEYRQAQLEQIAHQLRLTLAPAEIVDLIKLLQR